MTVSTHVHETSGIAHRTGLVRGTLQFRPPINGAAKMRNDDGSTDNETDQAGLEDPGARNADVAREEPAGDKVRFYDTLDAETRAEIDKVLELSTALARNVAAALDRGEAAR